MRSEETINLIKSWMSGILLANNGINGYRPIKGTTRAECMNVLGKIQELLKTNMVSLQEDNQWVNTL